MGNSEDEASLSGSSRRDETEVSLHGRLQVSAHNISHSGSHDDLSGEAKGSSHVQYRLKAIQVCGLVLPGRIFVPFWHITHTLAHLVCSKPRWHMETLGLGRTKSFHL